MGEAAKQNPLKKAEPTAGFIKAPKMQYFDEDKDFMDSYLNRFEPQDILGLNVQDRLLSRLRRGQVHHSIQLFGQVHLFQHRDRYMVSPDHQHFNVVRSGAITATV